MPQHERTMPFLCHWSSFSPQKHESQHRGVLSAFFLALACCWLNGIFASAFFLLSWFILVIPLCTVKSYSLYFHSNKIIWFLECVPVARMKTMIPTPPSSYVVPCVTLTSKKQYLKHSGRKKKSLLKYNRKKKDNKNSRRKSLSGDNDEVLLRHLMLRILILPLSHKREEKVKLPRARLTIGKRRPQKDVSYVKRRRKGRPWRWCSWRRRQRFLSCPCHHVNKANLYSHLLLLLLVLLLLLLLLLLLPPWCRCCLLSSAHPWQCSSPACPKCLWGNLLSNNYYNRASISCSWVPLWLLLMMRSLPWLSLWGTHGLIPSLWVCMISVTKKVLNLVCRSSVRCRQEFFPFPRCWWATRWIWNTGEKYQSWRPQLLCKRSTALLSIEQGPASQGQEQGKEQGKEPVTYLKEECISSRCLPLQAYTSGIS